jgi:L-alanine-DL-glutamate epimerase-like enolase superfamily enzyme
VSAGSEVRSLEVFPLRLRLREPFAVAYATVEHSETVLVRLTTRDGVEGWGEATPDEHVTGETSAASLRTLREVLGPSVVGADVGHPAAIVEHLDRLAPAAPAARAAVDVAVHDALARREGVPLWRMLERAAGGPSGKDHLQISRVVSMLAPDEMAAAAVRHVAAGFSTVKLKVGEPEDWALDVSRVAAVRDAVGPDIGIKVDANQGWRVPDVAVAAMSAMAASRPRYVEQPVDRRDLEGLAEVRRRVPGVAVMADEAVCDVGDVARVVDLGAADLVNLKLMKTGGLVHAVRADALAAGAGIGTQIGTMVESSVASAAGLHLAMALRNVGTVEMGGPLMIADDIGDLARCYHGERITLTERPGLGIDLDVARITGRGT